MLALSVKPCPRSLPLRLRLHRLAAQRTRCLHATPCIRNSASSAEDDQQPFDPNTVERAEDEVDVCIVGAGPAGLSAAIRLKQLEKERGGRELRVVVLEKGSEVGTSF